MCFGGNNSSKSESENYIKNKCYGCEYYNGDTNGVVSCDLGYKGINTISGCDDFTPDSMANCFNCFYKEMREQENSTVSYHYCSVYDVSHPFINEKFHGLDGYCQGFAKRE